MGDIILKIIHMDTMKKGDILWGRILYYIIVMIKLVAKNFLIIRSLWSKVKKMVYGWEMECIFGIIYQMPNSGIEKNNKSMMNY